MLVHVASLNLLLCILKMDIPYGKEDINIKYDCLLTKDI